MSVKKVLDTTINLLNQTIGQASYDLYNFLNGFVVRPIGLLGYGSKSYEFIKNHLERNIGNFADWSANQTGEPIGSKAYVDYDSWRSSWFNLDVSKKRSYDYLDFINKVYDKEKSLINYSFNGIRQVDYTSLIDDDKQHVGSVRNVNDYDNIIDVFSNDNVHVSQINPNNYGLVGLDTRLGVLSDYYVSNALMATELKGEKMGFSAYQDAEDNTDNSKGDNKDSASITKGIYKYFKPSGGFGLKGSSTVLSPEVKPNSYLIGDVIPWSTTDHVYDTSKIKEDLQRVANIQGGSEDDYSLSFLDLAQNTTRSNIYAPFGNYYSITYSLGLAANSGARTQKYIAASLLGKPLSEATDADIELIDGQNYTVPKNERGNLYYVGNGTRGTNYIDMMTSSTVDFVKYNGTTNSNIVRLNLIDAGNDNMFSASVIFEHLEAEGNEVLTEKKLDSLTFNSGVANGRYIQYSVNEISHKNDIIKKTNDLFRTNKIKSIIARFHTDEFESVTDARTNREYTSTAVSKYGMSRGRNLLKKNHQNIKDNDYSNPYCRVWTYHHEYATLNETIRPFESGTTLADTEVARYRRPSVSDVSGNWDDGQTRLDNLTARIKSNRLVRITPTNSERESVEEQLKHLMFSIENLAWKGSTDELDIDQKGPLGGRIMWFPPYNLEFNEQVSTNWNEVEFIGRGEKIPTYINTTRGGQLSFDILIDHPSVVNSFSRSMGGEGIGDVDDVKSTEQTLLRFFAGCEVLAPTTQTIINKENENKQKDKPSFDTIIRGEEEEEVFSFFVFFPNNYTGIDDINLELYNNTSKLTSSTIQYFPLYYLLYGYGPGYLTYEGKLHKDCINLVDEIELPKAGYEMRNAGGLSCSKNSSEIKTPEAYVDSLKNYFDDDEDNGNIKIEAYTSKTQTWAYRVDKAYENQVLNENNYVDNISYNLNNTYGIDKAIEAYGIENKDACFSFADTFIALNNEITQRLNGTIYNEVIVGEEPSSGENQKEFKHITNQKRLLEKLKTLKENNSNLKVVVSGYASSHGYTSANKVLSTNRKKTIETWLKKFSLFQNAEFLLGETLTKEFKLDDSVNSPNAKLGRAAYVQVFKKIEKLNQPIDNINVKDNKTEQDIRLEQERYENSVSNNIEEMFSYSHEILASIADGDNLKQRVATNIEAKLRENIEKGGEYDSRANNAMRENWYQTTTSSKNGYCDEYKFFSELERTDSFLHNKIVDKFKFFDPAFHSITPEGYQSRLTFLHQCTRQGSTISWSDNTMGTAANLAFGRPPILVLRIGDFYNTKIVATSLSIDYKNGNGIQWDLNDEGIGIMPMYAHITIGFNFYGGSDLGGPVSRLQNALSFNYYANTSVYDDRAEMVEYGGDGQLNRMKVNTLQ